MARAKSSRKPSRPSKPPQRSKKSKPSPSLPHGKVCYIEIPSDDVPQSVNFYTRVFGWKTRRRGDGATAFDDATGYVSGAWVKRSASSKVGSLVYISVDDAETSVKAVVRHGGKIVQPIGVDAPEITARFLDPAGNVLALYQHPTPEAVAAMLRRKGKG